MLKHRLLTAAVAAPLFIVAILFIPPVWFYLFSGIIVLGCAWEWAKVSGVVSIQGRLGFTALLLVMMVTAVFLLVPFLFMLESVISVYVATVLWVLAFFVVFRYAKADFKLEYRFVKLIAGFFLLLAFWYSANLLQTETALGFNALLLAFILIWSVDVGAYTVGRLWGRHKLIERVSPNKTWEGMIGGIGLCVIVALIFGFSLGWPWQQALGFALVAFVVALFSVIGDLLESMLKRQANVKDSGNLLPGHGGLLDRFDSAMAALPIFLLGMILLGF